MTFEEYAAEYPEKCCGCNWINMLYNEDFKDIDDNHGFWEICSISHDGFSSECPCVNCLVKMVCEHHRENCEDWAFLLDYLFNKRKDLGQ